MHFATRARTPRLKSTSCWPTNHLVNSLGFKPTPRPGRILATQLVPLLLAASLGSATPARLQRYTTRSWQTEEGLPHGYVLSAIQTRDGFLWLGTRAGLFRFDGIRFAEVEILSTNRLAIPSLCEGRDGSVWIGTETHGLFRVKDQSLWRYGKTNGVPGAFVRAICTGKDGSVWVATKGGLANFRDGEFRTFAPAHGLAGFSIEAICEDFNGDLWIGTAEALQRLHNGAVVQTLRASDGLPGAAIMSLVVDTKGRLWVGTSSGLAVISAGKVESVYDEATGLADRYVRTLCEDRGGTIWIGTYGGLYRISNHGEGTPGLPPPPRRCMRELNQEGTAYDRVMAVFEDREGNIWVAGRDGLSRLRNKPFNSLSKRDGLSQNSATAVCVDAQGDLWVAIWRGGLNRLQDDRFQFLGSDDGLTSDLLLSLWPAHDGGLWIGADHSDGLYHFKAGRFTHLDARDGLTNAAISVIYEDRATNLWIGTSRTLTRMRDGKFTDFTTHDGLAGNVVKAITEDQAGRLWIGTSRGLSCRSGARFESFTTENGLADNLVTALLADAKTNLWIGTANGGLHRLHDGKFTIYTMKQGLFSNEALEILEDDHGYLWLSCQNGVYRIEKKCLDDFDAGKIHYLPCASFGKDEGMTWVQCNSAAKPAGWKGPDGRLWFATTKGLAVAEPTVARNNSLPQVAITDLRVDKRRHPLAAGSPEPGATLVAAPILGNFSPTIALPPGRGELELNYTALSFQAPEKNRFRYKLEGFDTDWVEAENRRVAYYSRVPPGHYRFVVHACNNNGIWNESGASVDLTLQPHYWQSWWFWCLAIATTLAGVGGTVGWLVRRATSRRVQRLEQQHELEKERARIARDIHDDLGSSLTRISMLSELAEADKANPTQVEHHVRKIAASARETVRSLDEIVWAISPEYDTWNSLMEYLSEYANEFLAETGVRCRLDVPMDPPRFSLSSENRHSLFLVIKEALNNCLKHAVAKEVRIRVSETTAAVLIVIEDDGCGFDPQEQEHGHSGNGLRNMRARIEHLDGRFLVESRSGQGTKLTISVPVAGAATGDANV